MAPDEEDIVKKLQLSDSTTHAIMAPDEEDIVKKLQLSDNPNW